MDCMVDTHHKVVGTHCDKGCPSNTDGSYIHSNHQER